MRVFYCPVHGRITEDDVFSETLYRIVYPERGPSYDLYDCEHCTSWYFNLAKKKAKRARES